MNTIIRMKIGAGAILFAGLMATTGPAVAKATIECKNEIYTIYSVTGGSESQAMSAVEQQWEQGATNKYGQYWADFSNATVVSYSCVHWKVNGSVGWKCYLKAKPCAQVEPPSSSAAPPEPPPSRTTTIDRRLPESPPINKGKKRLRNTSKYSPTIPNRPGSAMTNKNLSRRNAVLRKRQRGASGNYRTMLGRGGMRRMVRKRSYNFQRSNRIKVPTSRNRLR